MSTENLYEYITGQSTTVSGLEQLPTPIDTDTWIRDQNGVKLGGFAIVIKDGTDTVLLEGTDYNLVYKDTGRSVLEGVDIYAGYRIINATYADVPLFIDADIIGGYTDRRYRPAYQNVIDATTIATGHRDLTVHADMSSAGYTLTLSSGERKNDRITVVADGEFACTITGPLKADVQVTDQATSFIWTGNIWAQVGGVGGGSGGAGSGLAVGTAVWFAGSGSIPAGMLLCDGNATYNPLDYPALFNAIGTTWGGDGLNTFAVPDFRGIHPGMIGTSVINGRTKGNPTAGIGDYQEDQFQGHGHSLATRNGTGGDPFPASGFSGSGAVASSTQEPIASTNGDPRFGDYTDVSQAMGRWCIQAFDIVQEVPGDPAIIRDWEGVYLGPPTTTLLNSWGAGLFYIGVSFDYGGTETRANGIVALEADGIERIIVLATDITGSDSVVGVTYNATPDTFGTYESGTDFSNVQILALYKWGYSSSGELNPPMDGWELIFEDWSNTGNVPNEWGLGKFRAVMSSETDPDTGASMTLDCEVVSMGGGQSRSPTYSQSTSNFQYLNHTATNEFTIIGTGGPTTRYIKQLWRFTGLINVVHSYHPDPRSVAQKDWVEVWDDAGAGNVVSVPNIWGTGVYLVKGLDSTGVHSTNIIQADDISVNQYGQTLAPYTTTYEAMMYRASTNVFEHEGSGARDHYIQKIYRWQDSQANDAPRNVLEDGWERVYIDYSNTSGITNEWGLGDYIGLLRRDDGLVVNTSRLKITEDGLAASNLDGSQTGGSAATRMRYTPGTNLFEEVSVSAVYYIVEIWKFTGLLRISASYNLTSLSDGPNQVKALDTTAGDIDAGLPGAPNLGDLFEVWNTGTGGNHVTGLPDGITLGDGKGIRLRYVDGWKYEDVIIDKYSVDDVSDPIASHVVTKWAGGDMTVLSYKENITNSSATFTYPEAFVSIDGYLTGSQSQEEFIGSLTLTSVIFSTANSSGSGTLSNGWCETKGRWK